MAVIGATVKIPIELDIDEIDILKEMGEEIAKQLNTVLAVLAVDGKVRARVGEAVDFQIRNTPEYNSLLKGELAAIFGLPNPGPILDSIIETVKNSIEIDVGRATFNVVAGLRASIKVSVLKDDFSDVLAVNGASYDTTDGTVDWLKWLLTAGDQIVVEGYDVKFGNSFNGSRTGEAIMQRDLSGFRVPPEFSGTLTNNWLTRAIEGMEDLIGNILLVELNRRL